MHGLLQQILYIASYLAGGWFAARETFERIRHGVLEVHFLMLAVAVGAASIGHWSEGVVLLFLFSLSGALESFAMTKTRGAIDALMRLAPKQAVVVNDAGQESNVAVEELIANLRVRVRPGEQFPVDGVVVEGETAVDESTLTGEATPVDKNVGSHVLAGTLNTWGRVDVRTLRPAQESHLSQIIRLVTSAQEQKAPAQRLTDRFGTWYTQGILLLSAGMFCWWHWGAPLPASEAFYRTMTLLVVASPCALVLSIPSAVLASIASGARQGILFRGGAAVELLGGVTRVAMDKTGTLTEGRMRVTRTAAMTPGQEQRVLELAAALEAHSEHPIARGIVQAAKSAGLTLMPVEGFRATTGMGIEGAVPTPAGRWRVRLGRRGLFGAADWLRTLPTAPVGASEVIVEARAEQASVEASGKGALGEVLRGQILLEDEIRHASAPLLLTLREAGLDVAMLTGDRSEAAQGVGAQVGLSSEECHGGLSPAQKVAAIRAWRAAGERVAMIGDGVNDAPSLAAADVGVAMGLRGSDAALAEADLVLVQDRLENFWKAYTLSRRARAIIHQNLTISLGVILALVIGALGAKVPLPLGVLGHEGSTLVVVLNSLRLLKK